MKKSDLRSGDLVKLRNEDICLVLLNSRVHNISGKRDILLSLLDGQYYDLVNFTEELKAEFIFCGHPEEYDVKEVCSELYVGNGFRINNLLGVVNKHKFHSSWKREDKKEMTIAEIEEKLGYPIKIVKEKTNE